MNRIYGMHVQGVPAEAVVVSRESIPDGVLIEYHHEFSYAWLAALVEAPLVGHPIMGVSDRGFAAQLPCGPQRSRYYLQCALDDGPEQWSDERIWDEIRLRLDDDAMKNAPVLDKLFMPLRSVVYAPMQYRNLFLAGDTAHLAPPTAWKGMNLALYDVDVLAQPCWVPCATMIRPRWRTIPARFCPTSGNTRIYRCASGLKGRGWPVPAAALNAYHPSNRS